MEASSERASSANEIYRLISFQVPKASALVLEEDGYRVQCRGLVAVKGKGEMET